MQNRLDQSIINKLNGLTLQDKQNEIKYYEINSESVNKIILEAKIDVEAFHRLHPTTKAKLLIPENTTTLLRILDKTEIDGMSFIKSFTLPEIKNAEEAEQKQEKLLTILDEVLHGGGDAFIHSHCFEREALENIGLTINDIRELKPHAKHFYISNAYALRQIIKVAGIPFSDFHTLTEKIKTLLLSHHHHLTHIVTETRIDGAFILDNLKLHPDHPENNQEDIEDIHKLIDSDRAETLELMLSRREKFITFSKKYDLAQHSSKPLDRTKTLKIAAFFHTLPRFLSDKTLLSDEALGLINPIGTSTQNQLEPAKSNEEKGNPSPLPKALILTQKQDELENIEAKVEEELENNTAENNNGLTREPVQLINAAEQDQPPLENEQDDPKTTFFWSSIRFLGGACLGMAIMAAIVGSGGIAAVPFVMVGIVSGLAVAFGLWAFDKIKELCCQRRSNAENDHMPAQNEEGTTSQSAKNGTYAALANNGLTQGNSDNHGSTATNDPKGALTQYNDPINQRQEIPSEDRALMTSDLSSSFSSY